MLTIGLASNYLCQMATKNLSYFTLSPSILAKVTLEVQKNVEKNWQHYKSLVDIA